MTTTYRGKAVGGPADGKMLEAGASTFTVPFDDNGCLGAFTYRHWSTMAGKNIAEYWMPATFTAFPKVEPEIITAVTSLLNDQGFKGILHGLAGMRKAIQHAGAAEERANAQNKDLKTSILDTLKELEAAGHASTGQPLHMLVDKAIDTERDRHASNLARIASALQVAWSVRAENGQYRKYDDWTSYLVNVIEMVARGEHTLAVAKAYDHAVVTSKIADNMVTSVEIEEESKPHIERRLKLIEERVEQLMARADADTKDMF